MIGMKRAARLLAGAWMSVACVAAVAADTPVVFDVGTMHVVRHGDRGSTVILIPGLASGSWVWKDVMATLQTEHRVYAVTLAGFDGRPAVDGDGLALANQSLHELIVSQRLDKPVLVGHSLGGTLALMFAAAHSELIAGVVAVDGLPVFPTTEGTPVAQRAVLAERIRAQLNVSRPEFEAQQLQYMRHIGVIGEEKALALARLAARSDPAATADYAARFMALDLRSQMRSIRVPVMELSPYLASDYAAMGIDEAGKTAYYRSLLAGVEKLEVVSIPQARHFAMIDQPKAIMQALARFLSSTAAP